MSRTLFDKIGDAHVVSTEADGTTLLYVDRQIVYEVTSPQAFEGLRLRRIDAASIERVGRAAARELLDRDRGARLSRRPRAKSIAR